mgnify:FL=1
MMKYINPFIILLWVVLVAGCIKENRDDCGRCTLRFSYVGDGTTEIFQKKIEKVNLYVFDANHNCIVSRTLKQNELSTQSISLELSPGTDRAVCIGNAFEATVITDVNCGNYKDIHCTHPCCLSGDIIHSNDSLYQGSKEFAVPKNRELTETIPFSASHIDMYVEVKGYIETAARSTSPLKLEVNNLSTWVNFNNEVTDDELATYYPLSDVEKQSYVYRFNILKQTEHPCLKLYDSDNKEIFSMQLADFLEKHPEINIDKNETIIPILIEFKSIGVEVNIPDWAIEDVKPEF